MPPKWRGRFMKAGEKLRREVVADRMRTQNPKAKTDEIQAVDETVFAQPLSSTSDDIDSSSPNKVRRRCDPLTNDDVEHPRGEPDWRQGRRIVELGKLADQLRSCIDCGQQLHLHRIQSEKKYGLHSLLYVKCECGVLNVVSTSKQHRSQSATRGVPIHDVNTKAALGKFINNIKCELFVMLLLTRKSES